MSIKWGLRGKVLALSSLLLLLPWFAYQFVTEMENFLRQGQEQTLLGNTSAVATALHERPSLFNEHASFLPSIKKGHDLYVYNLNDPIIIDGEQDDWAALSSFKINYQNTQPTDTSKNSNSFDLLLGKNAQYLYAYFQVFNEQPLKRQSNATDITDNDHLIFALTTPQGVLQRYIISVKNDGWFNAFRFPQHSIHAKNLTREKSIQGFWKSTTQGYNIELRIPLTLLGNKLGFQLHTSTADKPNTINHVIQTSEILSSDKLGSVLIPSPEVEKMLLMMSHTNSTLWVVDRHQRVIAQAGDIHQSTGTWPTQLNTSAQQSGWFSTIETALLAPIYDWFLDKPATDFIDQSTNTAQLNYPLIDQALQGEAASQWRLSVDKRASILSVAQPIFVNGKVIGVVLAEETNNGLLTLRNQTLQKMFNVLLAVIVIVGLLLFLFLSSVVKRIRQLRDQSETMLDQNGRLTGEFTASQHADEIGDLSRSMADMGKRLGEYHHYVEQLSSRLSHELRTPVAVVRSSLDNLSHFPAEPAQKKYIQRSQQGIQRLNKILTSMSEASRIEESLQQAEKQTLDLTVLMNGCLQGYEMIYPDSSFQGDLTSAPLLIDADPDFIVQLLDKIVHNAVEFSAEQQPVHLSLKQAKDAAILAIENTGPLLATSTEQDLFQSMISIRPASQQHDTHLGLGLYIAKMICDYHHANIAIQNNSDLTGVVVTITFPIKKANS
ncbi:proteobacterial dedicated sortase system histidine kinase [Psychromonas aquatilis]|uniref:histidine kinase n=1 Tax=Psychromonas aquatilis TaxID=2005072 RepID=A0ABU9GRT3_9GAMM